MTYETRLVYIQVCEWLLCFVEKIKVLRLSCHGDQVNIYIPDVDKNKKQRSSSSFQ